MYVFTELNGCEIKIGIYTFVVTKKRSPMGVDVTVGKAEVNFGLFQKISWRSHIRPGHGEAFAESAGRQARYASVDVRPIERAAGNAQAGHAKPVMDPSLVRTTLRRTPRTATCEWAALGDSLTEGMGVAQQHAYPAVLSRLASRAVCNFGMSGNTTHVIKSRLAEVLEAHPMRVVVILGANDAIQGIAPDVTSANILDIVEALRRQGIQVVVGGIRAPDPAALPYVQQMNRMREMLQA